MGYKLAASNGDTLAVPQLVLTHLTQTDGDTIRAALYILQTHDTDPRTMARALALPSIEAAKRTLQYWAGAGLLVSERGAAPAPAAEPARVDLASVANDPYVAVLCQEAQSIFGKTLSRSEMQRLVGLYLNDGWQPDVILLCCAEVTPTPSSFFCCTSGVAPVVIRMPRSTWPPMTSLVTCATPR